MEEVASPPLAESPFHPNLPVSAPRCLDSVVQNGPRNPVVSVGLEMGCRQPRAAASRGSALLPRVQCLWGSQQLVVPGDLPHGRLSENHLAILAHAGQAPSTLLHWHELSRGSGVYPVSVLHSIYHDVCALLPPLPSVQRRMLKR